MSGPDMFAFTICLIISTSSGDQDTPWFFGGLSLGGGFVNFGFFDFFGLFAIATSFPLATSSLA